MLSFWKTRWILYQKSRSLRIFLHHRISLHSATIMSWNAVRVESSSISPLANSWERWNRILSRVLMSISPRFLAKSYTLRKLERFQSMNRSPVIMLYFDQCFLQIQNLQILRSGYSDRAKKRRHIAGIVEDVHHLVRLWKDALNVSMPCTVLGSARSYTGKLINKCAANPNIERRRNDGPWFICCWSAINMQWYTNLMCTINTLCSTSSNHDAQIFRLASLSNNHNLGSMHLFTFSSDLSCAPFSLQRIAKSAPPDRIREGFRFLHNTCVQFLYIVYALWFKSGSRSTHTRHWIRPINWCHAGSTP